MNIDGIDYACRRVHTIAIVNLNEGARKSVRPTRIPKEVMRKKIEGAFLVPHVLMH